MGIVAIHTHPDSASIVHSSLPVATEDHTASSAHPTGAILFTLLCVLRTLLVTILEIFDGPVNVGRKDGWRKIALGTQGRRGSPCSWSSHAPINLTEPRSGF